jgi:tripartite-type tricarboxylate transporter receptor subunit TctC
MIRVRALAATLGKTCLGAGLLLVHHGTPAQTAFWQDALRRTTETPEWKRDLERHYQSDEFMAGNDLTQAVDQLYVQLKALLTDLDLAKREAR